MAEVYLSEAWCLQCNSSLLRSRLIVRAKKGDVFRATCMAVHIIVLVDLQLVIASDLKQ
jgi:hypothetical protein